MEVCRVKKNNTTGTNLIPARGKRSSASIKAEPTIPKHEFTLFATKVSINASEFDIFIFLIWEGLEWEDLEERKRVKEKIFFDWRNISKNKQKNQKK